MDCTLYKINNYYCYTSIAIITIIAIIIIIIIDSCGELFRLYVFLLHTLGMHVQSKHKYIVFLHSA